MMRLLLREPKKRSLSRWMIIGAAALRISNRMLGWCTHFSKNARPLGKAESGWNAALALPPAATVGALRADAETGRTDAHCLGTIKLVTWGDQNRRLKLNR